MTPAFLPFTRPDIDAASIAAVVGVLESGWLTGGPRVAEFEQALAAWFGRPVRVFANGTATLETALRVAGVGPGDEVVTTALTWVATANVILAVGATPVFVDVDPRSRNIDLAAAAAAVGPRTRAILPVYLGGLPVDMDALYAIAREHGLRVVEDAAQAIDSLWNGDRIGSFGDLVSFSFQANKNLTCGEGGCLVFGNPDDALAAERLRLQGVVRSGLDGMDVVVPGGKSNLSDIHAAIGLGQLARLASITRRRAELATAYFEAARLHELEALGIELPLPTARLGATTNWHMFQVVLPADRLEGGRAAVMQALRDAGIGTGVHYPALHLFSCYRERGWREGMLPHTERIGRGILTLPLFPAMDDGAPARVCAALADACRRLAR